MKFAERLDGELKGALKAKDRLKVSAIRMLKSALFNAGVQKGKTDLEEAEALEVVAKLVKQREESIEAYRKGSRPDLAEKEEKEAEILRAYLPPALPEGELKSLIQEAIREAGASGPQAMGQVMKLVMPKVAGRADGKTVSALVRQALQP